MITKWNLCNFKSVAEKTELEMAPLTIFAGANSSGKSTLLQSILLVAQTLSNRVGSRSVVLNGNLVRLGQFDDLRTKKSAENLISLGWTCQPPAKVRRSIGRRVERILRSAYFQRSEKQLQEVSCEIVFDAEMSGPESKSSQIQPRLFSSILQIKELGPRGRRIGHSLELKILSPASAERSSIVNWAKVANQYPKSIRNSLNYSITLSEELASDLQGRLPAGVPIGCTTQHFLPGLVSIGFDQEQEDARLLVKGITQRLSSIELIQLRRSRKKIPPSALNLVRESLNREQMDLISKAFAKKHRRAEIWDQPISFREWQSALQELPRSKAFGVHWELRDDEDLHGKLFQALTEGRKEKLAISQLPCPHVVRDATGFLESFFAKFVKYLGPLRDEPKPLYSLFPQSDPRDVGLRGEMTAAVLDYGKNSTINYVPPSCFDCDDLQLKPREGTLQSAIRDWLQYLGVATEVAGIDRGKLGHEIKVAVTTNQMNHDLMHVGVGVSQVLPILVMCLLAEKGTTFVIEQPELHLHPNVQSKLGDFFLSMVSLGKQCIIETHSEHLINRLRLRAANEKGESTIKEKLGIYFVSLEQGQSSFRKVELNEFGAILDWPDGFFDESQREAEKILLAAVQKRKSMQQQ